MTTAGPAVAAGAEELLRLWGGTVASIVADEGFGLLGAPIRRVAAACVSLPFADALEEQVSHRGVGDRRRSVIGEVLMAAG